MSFWEAIAPLKGSWRCNWVQSADGRGAGVNVGTVVVVVFVTFCRCGHDCWPGLMDDADETNGTSEGMRYIDDDALIVGPNCPSVHWTVSNWVDPKTVLLLGCGRHCTRHIERYEN